MIFPCTRLKLLEQFEATRPNQDMAVTAVSTLTEPAQMKRFVTEYIVGMRRDDMEESYDLDGSLVIAMGHWVAYRRVNRTVAASHLLLRALDHSQPAFERWMGFLEAEKLWPPKLPE